MPEPTASTAAFALTGGGIVILGTVTGLHPVLLAAGFAGGLWAQLYLDEMLLLRRLASMAVASLAGSWIAPALAFSLPRYEFWPKGAPADLMQIPLALLVGLVSHASGAVIIKVLSSRGDALVK